MFATTGPNSVTGLAQVRNSKTVLVILACLLRTDSCLPLTAYYLLLTTYYLRLTTYYFLLTPKYLFEIWVGGLRVVRSQLVFAGRLWKRCSTKKLSNLSNRPQWLEPTMPTVSLRLRSLTPACAPN